MSKVIGTYDKGQHGDYVRVFVCELNDVVVREDDLIVSRGTFDYVKQLKGLPRERRIPKPDTARSLYCFP